MAESTIYCQKCEKRYDIRLPVEGLKVRCTTCGGIMSEGVDEWGTAGYKKDRYRKENIGGCKVEKKIAVGRDSITYRAIQKRHKMPVLIEIFPHDDPAYDESRIIKLFHGLAEGSKIRHPNVAAIYDLGRTQDYDYVVRELSDGGSVRREINRKGKLELRAAMPLIEDVLRALRVAEKKGLHHGQLSTDNLKLDYDGSVKLDHFGRPLEEEDLDEFIVAGNGVVTGPAYYVSPERVRQQETTDIKSDLYSLGVTMFEMLSGKRPFGGRTATEIMELRLSEDPPRLAALERNMISDVSNFVRNLMQRDPEDRPKSASKALEQLREIGLGKANSGTKVQKSQPTGKSRRRLGAIIWTLLAFLLVFLAITPMYMLTREEEQKQRQAMKKAAPVLQRGRVLIVVEKDSALPEDQRLALMGRAKVALARLPKLAPLSPFLAESCLAKEGGYDLAVLKTDPAYLLQVARIAGQDQKTWQVLFASIKGMRWRQEESVAWAESKTPFEVLNEALEKTIAQALSEMGEIEDPSEIRTLAGEEIWHNIGKALKAERSGEFADAYRVLGNAQGEKTPDVLVEVLKQYYRLADAWTDGRFPEEVPLPDCQGLKGEYRYLGRTLRAFVEGKEQGGGVVAEYLVAYPYSVRAHFLLAAWRDQHQSPSEEIQAALWRLLEQDPGYFGAVRLAGKYAAKQGAEQVERFLKNYRKAAWLPEQKRAAEEFCASLKDKYAEENQ
ncbi:MAG: protein kinase domain-containing protein [Candidatus Brocadiia bacterium]